MQTHTEVVATPGSSSTVTSPALPGVATNQSVTTAYDPYSARRARSASTATPDAHLMGAEIMFGTTLIGHVEGLVHDPISQRVRRLITSYGSTRRRVGVPIEWVIKRSASRLELAVGARSLDNLADRTST